MFFLKQTDLLNFHKIEIKIKYQKPHNSYYKTHKQIFLFIFYILPKKRNLQKKVLLPKRCQQSLNNFECT